MDFLRPRRAALSVTGVAIILFCSGAWFGTTLHRDVEGRRHTAHTDWLTNQLHALSEELALVQQRERRATAVNVIRDRNLTDALDVLANQRVKGNVTLLRFRERIRLPTIPPTAAPEIQTPTRPPACPAVGRPAPNGKPRVVMFVGLMSWERYYSDEPGSRSGEDYCEEVLSLGYLRGCSLITPPFGSL